MKKIHIALVGGQPIPVYIGIKKDGMANTVGLICSEQSVEESNRIKSQFPKREVNIVKCSPVDITEMENIACGLFEKYKDCEITLNLTSGTKLWALTFYRIFSSSNFVHFIYVDQTNLITDILTKETQQGYIDKLVRFELYGTKPSSYVLLDEYTDVDFQVMESVRKLRCLNKVDFNVLTGRIQESDLLEHKPIPHTENGSSIEYSLDDKYVKIELLSHYDKDKSYIKEFSSEHVFNIVFKHGWFELMTAKQFRNIECVKGILLNCNFAYLAGMPKNEIDVIVDLGTRLLFVECKTKIYDMTDIDKFHSALRNFSGTSSVGLFVSHDKPNMNMYKNVEEKCRDNNIRIFNFALWREEPLKYPSIKQIVENIILQQNKR